MLRIKIANKWIGEQSPVFIIAEAGINHNGNLQIAKKLIKKAKECGADAIKFQTFTAGDLTSTKSKYFKIFENLEFSHNDFLELYRYAKKQNIIIFSSPFSFEAVDMLIKLKTPAFKIASGDITNIPLIKYSAAKKKPMIVSTGMSTIEEIQNALRTIQSQGNKRIIILHSVSAYPAPIDEINLKVIPYLEKKIHYPIGYSDNGSDQLVPIIAVSIGATVIEKHFTLNRKFKGPDHKLSSDPKQFRIMVKNIRLVEKMLGNGLKKCQPSEIDNRINARRSITTNVTIPKGTKIKRNMIGIKRPATGIEPKYFNQVIGKTATHTIKSEESLKWKDIR